MKAPNNEGVIEERISQKAYIGNTMITPIIITKNKVIKRLIKGEVTQSFPCQKPLINLANKE